MNIPEYPGHTWRGAPSEHLRSGLEERHPREGWRASWEPPPATTTGSPSCVTFARCRQVQSLCSAPGGSSGRCGPHFSSHGGLGLGDAPPVGPSPSQIGTLGAQGSGAPSGLGLPAGR